MARDFDSVVDEVAQRLRLDTSQSGVTSMIQGWVNDVIEDIHGRHDWYWAIDRRQIQTVIDITAGTVSVSAGGTTVTGVGTAFSSSDVDKFIQFDGSNDWYRVATYTSATSIEIEGGYNGTTALSAGTYVLRKVFYSVGVNVEKIISIKQAQTNQDLICIDRKDFDTFLTFADDTGKARRFCVFGTDGSEYIQFMIYPHADEAYNLELTYKDTADTGNLNWCPGKWTHVVLDGALVRGWEYVALGQPEFNRAILLDKKADYERGIARMIADAEPESDYQAVLMNRDQPNSLPSPRLPGGLSIPLDD